jgi:hypothetical protein
VRLQQLSAPSTVRPDTRTDLASLALPVTEIGYLSSKVLIDSDQVNVTVYYTKRDPHAKDAVLVVISYPDQMFVYEADMYNAGLGFTVAKGGPPALFHALRDIGVLNAACKSMTPLSIIPAHGVMQTLEGSLSELAGLNIDVGCE